MTVPGLSLNISASCAKVDGEGYECMILHLLPGGRHGQQAPATGHITVVGGPNDGRCLALVCPHHATAEGYADVKTQLVAWMRAGLLTIDLGPGPAGAPEVLHIDHMDPLPEHRH
jgi:hypothetical protein